MKRHAAKEAKELRAAEDERQNEQAEMHVDYLNTLKQKKGPKGPKTYSPVGSYIIDSKEIEQGWSDPSDALCLDIRQTTEPGVFEASFDFGVLEGVMIISAEKNALEQYCSQPDYEAEADWDEDEDEDEDEKDDRKNTTGSKRKAEPPRGRGRPPKKSETGPARLRTYLLRLKCCDTGEGEIKSTAEKGTITFTDEKLASFKEKADLPSVGDGAPSTARKISDTAAHSTSSWADYLESAYGYARTSRWR